MKPIIEYFDRAYIINLSDRTDRRRQAEQEFRRVGISIPNDKVRFFNAVRPSDKGGFQDIGTRGCFNSHRSILEIANQENLRNILIFEDDVSFRSISATFERHLMAQLSDEDWDVVFFGYSMPSDEFLTGPLMRWPNDIRSTHFYGVNRRFIRRMLQYMNDCELRPRDHPDGGPMPADGVYNHVRYVFRDINLLLAVPNLAYQRSSRTDIAQAHFLDRIVWLGPILRGVRAIKHRGRMVLDSNKLRRRMKRS